MRQALSPPKEGHVKSICLSPQTEGHVKSVVSAEDNVNLRKCLVVCNESSAGVKSAAARALAGGREEGIGHVLFRFRCVFLCR